MGIDVSKLTSAEALKALQDGKISYEELSSLSAAEQKALAEALGGKELKVGDVLDVNTGKIEKVEPEKKEGWLKRTWKNASVFGKIGLVAACAAGATALVAGGVGLVGAIGGGRAALVGVAALTATLVGCGKQAKCTAEVDGDGNPTGRYVNEYGERYATLTGCQEDIGSIQQGSTFNNNVGNTVNVTVDTSQWTASAAQISSQLATLIALFSNMNSNLSSINTGIQTMLGWGAKLDQIVKLLVDNGIQLDKVIELLTNNGTKLDEIAVILKDQTAQLTYNQEEIKALLNKIIGLTAEGNNLSNKQIKLLKKILVTIAKFRNDSNGDHTKIIELLDKILKGVNNLDNTVADGMAEILGKMGTITENQATQLDTLYQILAKIGQGNATMNEIKNFIQNLDLGTMPNLETIESLLAQILAKENANHDMLTNINDNTALINASVNALKAEVTNLKNTVAGFSAQNHADLMAILNKIPTDISTCNCDCARIIQLLEEIAQRLGDGDYNHEGYRDDYDDILG